MAAAGIELRSACACLAGASSSSCRSNFAFRFSANNSISPRFPRALLPLLRGSSLEKLSFGLRGRPLRASQSLEKEIRLDLEEDWEEEEEVDGDEEEDGADEYPSDVESLEEEARKVAREFSLSISRELGTGTWLLPKIDFGYSFIRSSRVELL